METGMKSIMLIAVALSCFIATPGVAGERQVLGYGRLFTNDILGDGRDRWRTGSYTVSRVSGLSWSGQAPLQFGELREYRLRGEIVAPASLSAPAPGDRRYAGIWSFGMHSHSTWQGNQLSLGADLVVIGEQTGLSRFQDWAHSVVGLSDPVAVSTQIGNTVRPTLVAQTVRPMQLGERVQLRPFVEAQAGYEDFLRGGVDMIVGRIGQSDLLLREQVTGHLYPGITDDGRGTALVLGGDVAKVYDSVLLPEAQGYQLTDTRKRLRLGVRHEGRRGGMFYGLTWLGKEFEAQTDEQVVGSLRFRIDF